MRDFKVKLEVTIADETVPEDQKWAKWTGREFLIHAPGEFQALVTAGGELAKELGYVPLVRRVSVIWENGTGPF